MKKKTAPATFWNTVNPASKIATAVLFIVLPMTAFFGGTYFQREIDKPILELVMTHAFNYPRLMPANIEGKTMWTGTLERCTPPANPQAWDCGKCYDYYVKGSDGTKLLFNDDYFKNLSSMTGKSVKLTGQKLMQVSKSCPKMIKADSVNLQ